MVTPHNLHFIAKAGLIRNMMPLMNRNIALNGLEDTVNAEVLNWGDELPEYAVEGKIDLVLAADCVYLEQSFPLLEKTLVDLYDVNSPRMLMTYKKRRKADTRFFKALRKSFDIIEITDYPGYDKFKHDSVYLYEFKRKLRKVKDQHVNEA